MTSSNTRAGRVASKRSIASGPSAAVSTRKPSRCSATASASRYDCSSSTTRIRGGSAIGPPWLVLRPMTARRAVGERYVERERGAFAFARLHGDFAAVRLRDMADDRKTESGAARVATARPVDPIEAFPDPFEIAGRNADAVIAHDERDAVVDDACADLDRLIRTRVLDRVVDEVHERTAHLAGVAEDLEIGRFGPDRTAEHRPRRPRPARCRCSPRAGAEPASARGSAPPALRSC